MIVAVGKDSGILQNPTLNRYEQIVRKLKKMLSIEKGNLQEAKTLYSREIEGRTQLEQLLRQCVDDVKSEISKKRSENKMVYKKVTFKAAGEPTGGDLTA